MKNCFNFLRGIWENNSLITKSFSHMWIYVEQSNCSIHLCRYQLAETGFTSQSVRIHRNPTETTALTRNNLAQVPSLAKYSNDYIRNGKDKPLCCSFSLHYGFLQMLFIFILLLGYPQKFLMPSYFGKITQSQGN